MHKSMIYKKNIGNSFYRTMLFCYILISVFNASALPMGPVTRIYNYVCVIGCIYILTRRKVVSRRQLRISLIILLVFTVSAISAKNFNVFVYALLIITADKSFEKIVKTVFVAASLGVLLIVAMSLIGIIPDYTYDHHGMTAHSLGFYYYSTIPYYLLFLLLMYIYLRKNKLKICEIIALFLIQLLSYRVFTVRLAFISGIGVVCLSLLIIKWKLFSINNSIVKYISVMLFPLAEIFSIYIGKNYSASNARWAAIDSFLTNRLSQASIAFAQYSIKFLGQQIEMHGSAAIALGLYSGAYFFIDSGYVFLILVYGLVFTAVVMTIYSFLMLKACKYNNKQLYIWLITVLMFSFINDVLIGINLNPILLCLPAICQRCIVYKGIRLYPGRKMNIYIR